MLRSSWLTDILLLTLITSLFFGVFLGTRNLSVPDEARYAEIPREMIINKDYIIPRINGVKYFEKPPLFYWMQVASIKAFGLNEWSLRAATALMGLIGILATYLFSRRFFGRRTGVLSALILGSMTLYFSMSHIVTLDMTVSIFITLSLYLFYIAVHPTTQQKRWWIWGAFVMAAAAVMTKGLIGIMFPCAIAFLWMLIFNRWRLLFQLHLISSLFIFLILVAPWHILVQLKAPEFFHFYFIEQQFLRYATLSAHRYQSPIFYIPVILLGTLPWVCFLPQALNFFKQIRWKNRFQYENELFLVICFLFIFLFYSFSDSKLIPYIIPTLPPLAILIARYFSTLTSNTKSMMRGYAAISSIYFIGAMTIIFLQLTPYYPLPKNIIYLCISCLVMVVIGFYGIKQKGRILKPIIAVYLASNLVLISAIFSVDYFDNHSVKPLVIFVKQQLQPQDEVILYHSYHQEAPLYLQRTVTVNESFDELKFGANHGNTEQWMIHEKEFKKRWQSNKTIYLFISKKQYTKFLEIYPQNKGWVIARDANNLVLTNHLNTVLQTQEPK